MKNEECRIKNVLNEECRMKNEEWELHFLISVKREKGKGRNRADGI